MTTETKKGGPVPLDLTPDLTSLGAAVSRDTRFVWVGVYPHCPVSNIHIAGVCFPKMTYSFATVQGQRQASVRVGAITQLEQHQAEKLLKSLSRTVVRFLGGAPTLDVDVPFEELVERLATRWTKNTRGHLITVPTPEHMQMMREQNRPLPEYTPNPETDIHAARLIYAVPCENQDRPAAGTGLPTPLADRKAQELLLSAWDRPAAKPKRNND